MKFTLTLTVEDCIEARRLSLRPRPTLRFALYVVLALFAGTILWQLVEGVSAGRLDSGFWQLLGIAAYLYAIFFLWMPYRVRKVFRQQKSLQVPTEMELTDTHFIASSANGSFQMPWKDFHKWKKNERMLLVYQSEAILHPIPLRALPDKADQERLFALLRQALGPEKA